MQVNAIQVFSPDPAAVYTIDAAARLAQVPRHLVLVYAKRGFVTPMEDPEFGGYYFDAGAIRRLRRIAYLQRELGVNLAGIQLILELADQIDGLQNPGASAPLADAMTWQGSVSQNRELRTQPHSWSTRLSA